MPVILGDKDLVNTWLDDPSTSKLKPLLSPYENSDLVSLLSSSFLWNNGLSFFTYLRFDLQVWYPVTPAIGKPTFDGPECIQQVRLTSFPLVVYNSRSQAASEVIFSG